MRRINIVFIASCLFISASFISCQEDEQEIGEAYGKSEGLTATAWVVNQVFLVDEGNPAKPEIEITSFYTSGNNLLEVKFDLDGTYELTPGDGVNFFPSSGSWAFNDSFAPTKLTLTSEDQVVDSPLGGPTRISDNELKLNVQRFCQDQGEEKAVLGYRLVFVRK